MIDKKTKKILKKICRDMTGLDLNFFHSQKPLEATSLAIIGLWKFKWFTISLNSLEVEVALPELISRSLNPDYALLQVLLHEICHYKLYKRTGLSMYSFIEKHKYLERDEKEERLCDRYARLNYKKVLRRYYGCN